MIKLLCLGDVVGPLGTQFVCDNLLRLKAETAADAVIVNGENCTRSYNLDTHSAYALFDAGADVITGGNHTMQYEQVHDMLCSCDRLLRPHNYPSVSPGKGYCILPMKNGIRLLVINLSGQAIIEPPADNPFIACQNLIRSLKGEYDIAVCDLHAEATGEKNAFFRCFDGTIAAMYGTHTHVATADERILPHGSACITDIGMCGAHDSVIGMDAETAIHKYRTATRPQKPPEPTGDMQIHGVLFELDERSNRTVNITRICYTKG